MDVIIFFTIFLFIYFLPTLIATGRKTHNADGVFALNLLIGWTIIGWVIALVMACGSDIRKDGAPNIDRNQPSIEDLERLAKLHENGALTDEEFAVQKAKILGESKTQKPSKEKNPWA